MQHIFIVDPFATLKIGHDSSLALMNAALKKNHGVWQCEMADIFYAANTVNARCRGVQSVEGRLQLTAIIKIFDLRHKSDVVVWMRKDPPVDNEYTRTCQLLRLSTIPVVNNPNALVACDEKLFALEFPDLLPATWVLQDIAEIKSLLREKRQLIVKGIGGKGGEGVFMLSHEDRNTGSILETITQRGCNKVILQEYLPGVRHGDKRIFLCDGIPIGAVLRVPKSDDHRANMAAGGCVEKTTLTAEEHRICKRICARLRQLGIYLAGLDVIQEKLTEINITSPTCLEEIARFDGTDPAGEIISWSERLIEISR